MTDALRILIVEDSLVAGEMMETILTHQGFDVQAVARSGQAAVEALELGPFDAAIVDLELPDMAGAELLAELRVRTPATRLVACSAHDCASQHVAHARRHADAVISKEELVRSADLLRNLCRSTPRGAA